MSWLVDFVLSIPLSCWLKWFLGGLVGWLLTKLTLDAWTSPLSKVPHAHWSCGISSAWILWARFNSREIATIHETHRRLGPVVRLGPEEVSVNCVTGGIHTIYTGGFEKHSWYSNLFDNYG
jgi:unspecific monooxygenase